MFFLEIFKGAEMAMPNKINKFYMEIMKKAGRMKGLGELLNIQIHHRNKKGLKRVRKRENFIYNP